MNCFDVHDRDVTAIIYQLMFSAVGIEGNDRWYKINPAELLENFSDGNTPKYFEERWAKSYERGPSNCYFNHDEMKKMHKNWPTLHDAILHFHEWLKSKDVNPEDDLMVKVWW